MKTIIVACGNGVATIQLVAYKISRRLKKLKIDAVVEVVNHRSLSTMVKKADIYVEIMKSDIDYGIPKIDGICFLTGENEQEGFKKLINCIKGE